MYPKSGNLIELSGESGTAKTEILLNIIVSCILPLEWKTYKLAGIGTGVVFVDTQCQFSMLRVFSLLEKRVTRCIASSHSSKVHGEYSGQDDQAVNKSSNSKLEDDGNTTSKLKEHSSPPTAEEIENFIKTCLEKLLIFRCNTSQQLLVTFHSLETLFANSLDLSVLMVDNWSAFYWMDRASAGNHLSQVETIQQRIISSLEKLLQDYHITAFVAKRPLFKSSVKRDKVPPTSGPSMSLSSSSLEPDDPKSSNQDFVSKDWNRILSQKFQIQISEQPISTINPDANLQTIFVASRVLPKPVITKNFFISEIGLNFLS